MDVGPDISFSLHMCRRYSVHMTSRVAGQIESGARRMGGGSTLWVLVMPFLSLGESGLGDRGLIPLGRLLILLIGHTRRLSLQY
jgi:hypothetical protein